MQKPLSEMTLEELWQLFPIRLTPHNTTWKTQYEREQANLLRCLSPLPVFRISHVGSSAVPTIHAKPIVDILLEIPKDKTMDEYQTRFTENGWICMQQSERRRSFNKGYTPNGFADEVFHLHLRIQGDCDELYFRDYLIDYPDAAKAYETVKLSLWKQYEFHRDNYTDGKSEFVKKYTEIAKTIYPNRY